MATWCKELTHWKRPWCWERLGAGGEGDNRGWDGWIASLTWWTWVWVDSRSWWWTGRPGVLQFMGSQRVRHDWETELNWTELIAPIREADALHQTSLITAEFPLVSRDCSSGSFQRKSTVLGWLVDASLSLAYSYWPVDLILMKRKVVSLVYIFCQSSFPLLYFWDPQFRKECY